MAPKKNGMASGLIILAVLVLFGGLTQYSSNKGVNYEGNRNGREHRRHSRGNPQNNAPPAAVTSVVSANPAGQNSAPARVSGGSNPTQGLPPSCTAGPKLNADELLPKGGGSWSQLNPQGAGNMKDVNLLSAGYHLGINTIGNTLRNANLQLRSEPPNPTSKVSPWLNTTISPDLMRVPLEIGCGPQ